ncbi:MAG: hypothetical protein U0X20_24365 [Caldilineaceae bacterium]
MSAKRLEVQIDVLNRPNQRALPLADLTPPELIAAILQEFRDIEYLGVDGTDYCLLRSEDGMELDPTVELGEQLGAKPHLRLVERPLKVPSGAQRVEEGLYLREEAGGRVFRLAWLPAIVGRSDATLKGDELVAANLESLPTGLRVSRRHIRVTGDGGQYFAECMSSNPASLRRANGGTAALGRTRQSLVSGDVLYLDRSEIALKFIVRSAQGETAQDESASTQAVE